MTSSEPTPPPAGEDTHITWDEAAIQQHESEAGVLYGTQKVEEAGFVHSFGVFAFSRQALYTSGIGILAEAILFSLTKRVQNYRSNKHTWFTHSDIGGERIIVDE